MKNWSLKVKVFLTLLSLIAVMMLSMAGLMKLSFEKNFTQYRKNIEIRFNNNLLKNLENHYAETQGWHELTDNRRLWNEMINDSMVESRQSQSQRPRPPRDRKPPRKRQNIDRNLNLNQVEKAPPHRRPRIIAPISVLNLEKNKVVGTRSILGKDRNYININHDSRIVGYLAVTPFKAGNNDLDRRFAKSMKSMILNLTLIMLLLAILLTFPIARYFTKRIDQINSATEKISAGDFEVQIQTKTNDEIDQLSKNFNHLARTLNSNRNSQRTMMADIAHELRTPVAVILGEIEAIQDGVHPANHKTFGLLHSQISSLKNLINDLNELSESDLGSLKYQMQSLDLTSLLKVTVQSYVHKFSQKNITLTYQSSVKECMIKGDKNRLNQLFNNLLNNSFEYTDENGKTEIKLSEIDSYYRIEILDSKPGLNKKQIDKIFDRLYRAEESRNRNSGGTGLGLAIVKQIAKSHNAEIYAENSPLGGINIILEFPKP